MGNKVVTGGEVLGGEAPKGAGALTFGQGATSLPPRLYVPAKIL